MIESGDFGSQPAQTGVLDWLAEAEVSLRIGVERYFTGNATREEKEYLGEARTNYEQALAALGHQFIDASLREGATATKAKAGLMRVYADSVATVLGEARADHYFASVVERTRHRLSRSRGRRAVGAVVTAGVFGVGTWSATKGIEVTLKPQRLNPFSGGAVVGSGAAFMFARAFKPTNAIKSIIKRPSNRVRGRTQQGINMHPLDVIQSVEAEVALRDDLTQEEKIRETYIGVARRTKGEKVYNTLCVLLNEKDADSPDERKEIVEDGAAEAVACLYSLFNLATFDQAMARRVTRLGGATVRKTQKFS